MQIYQDFLRWRFDEWLNPKILSPKCLPFHKSCLRKKACVSELKQYQFAFMQYVQNQNYQYFLIICMAKISKTFKMQKVINEFAIQLQSF